MVYNMAAQNKHSCGGASIDSPRDNTFNSAARAKSTDWLRSNHTTRICWRFAVDLLATCCRLVGDATDLSTASLQQVASMQ